MTAWCCHFLFEFRSYYCIIKIAAGLLKEVEHKAETFSPHIIRIRDITDLVRREKISHSPDLVSCLH